MRFRCVFLLVIGVSVAGIALPQSLPAELVKYLNLTDAQNQSIGTLNRDFGQYTNAQQTKYYELASDASAELAKDSPDAGVAGSLYAQMEMILRDYRTQTAQVQSKVAAVLTTGQIVLVSALLSVARLQALVSEAQSVYMETYANPYNGLPTASVSGGLSWADVGGFYSYGCCIGAPLALSNYLGLSDGQNAAIGGAIQGYMDYLTRESFQVQELRYSIQKLTAAQTIDTAALGAAYVAIAQIQRDESMQSAQLMKTVRSVLTDSQQPLLKALDNALALSSVEYAAVGYNILVLPPGLGQTYGFFGNGNFGMINNLLAGRWTN